MTKLSRIPIKPEKMSLFLDDFWTAVASLKSKTEAKDFFNQFLTHTERKMFAKRFQVAMMLLLGYDYQAVSKRIKVSNDTIAKVNNWLEENREALIKVASRIIKLKDEKMRKIEEITLGRRTKKTFGSALLEEGIGMAVKKIKQARKEASLVDG